MDTTKYVCSAVVGLMLLLKRDQRGQEVADSEHNGAKSIYTEFNSFLRNGHLTLSPRSPG